MQMHRRSSLLGAEVAILQYPSLLTSTQLIHLNWMDPDSQFVLHRGQSQLLRFLMKDEKPEQTVSSERIFKT